MEPPVTIINAGDTTFFTDGAMHALQHIVEAREKGYKMPFIFQINANNSAISARFDYGKKWGDDGDFGVQRIQERFDYWSSLIDPGYTTWVDDLEGGIKAMRAATDQARIYLKQLLFSKFVRRFNTFFSPFVCFYRLNSGCSTKEYNSNSN